MLNNKFLKILFISLLAGLIYGGWAAYVNSEHGYIVALHAGLGQGVYAFFSTSVVTAVARASYDYLEPNRFTIALSFLASFAVMLNIPLAVHWMLDTPNIWQAISPGLVWGSGYIGILLKIWSKDKTQMPY